MDTIHPAVACAFDRIGSMPSFQRAVEARRSGDVNLVGLTTEAAFWHMAALRQREGRPLLLVMPDDAWAHRASDTLSRLCGGEIPILGAREWSLYEARAFSREGDMKRAALLSDLRRGRFEILIVTADALQQRLCDPARIERFTCALQIGATLSPLDADRRLARNGYERVDRVERPGHYARRGDILDVFPFGLTYEGEPVALRLSFFDIEIDEIKGFDPLTQRSVVSFDRVVIPPAREWLLDAKEKYEVARAIREYGRAAIRERRRESAGRDVETRLEAMVNGDAERIENGLYFPAFDRWLPLVDEAVYTVFDYVSASRPLLAVCELQAVRQRMDAAEAGFRSRLSGWLEKGETPAVAAELQMNPTETMIRLDQAGTWLAYAEMAMSGNGFPGAERIEIHSRAADGVRHRPGAFEATVRHDLESGDTVILMAGDRDRSERLADRLNQANLHGPLCAPLPLERGFALPEAGLSVYGTSDLFGARRKRSTTRRRGKREIFFKDLKEGAYVVHEDHGVGRYEGTETIATSDGLRDYLRIVYKDGVLHMPVDRLDLLSPYIQVGESGKAKLSRMGGTEWAKQKARARDSIRKLATDLVRLYTERRAYEGHAFAPDTPWQAEFESLFPYEETEDQARAIAEVKADMESPRIMDRLICGDVGFGKTEIAFRAMFKCVMDGKQAALLVPTTILAKQHFEELRERLRSFPVTIRQMSRFVTERERRETAANLRKGTVDIVVGTHRLLSKDVRFKDLGLLVIDEEQRFGVDHKEMIKAQMPTVDVLSLTATPIPRTLHMSLSGIRDISILEEGPDDRRPIWTTVAEYDPALVTDAIMREYAREGQVFYLYNRTHTIDRKVKELGDMMPGLRIAAAHGRMNEHELERVIADFLAGEYDVLVCTTIIESGIDMPRVNTIVVEDADRLGLAQMYQIRGRVGRSERQAYALITYRPDKILNEQAQKRLMAIRDFTELGSGFQIALRDLEVRGAGNILGGEQSGHLDAIGYDLYCKMLDENIRDLMHEEKTVPRADTLIDLETDASLPDGYVSQTDERLELYRRMASLDSADDYRDIYDEMLDRYGEPPPETTALLDISYLRAFGERSGFEKISARGRDLELLLAPHHPVDMELVSRLMSTERGRDHIRFDAGRRPRLIVLNGARERNPVAFLRKLFMAADDATANAV